MRITQAAHLKREQIMQGIQSRFQSMASTLNEKQKRWFVASEAQAIGAGGIALVQKATGMTYITIKKGLKEIAQARQDDTSSHIRVRKQGGGRKKNIVKDADLVQDIETIVSPTTRGDPERLLRWSLKSTQSIADALNAPAHRTSERLVARILKKQGYSLQSNRKTQEGKQHPDRDAQFQFIEAQAQDFQQRQQPVISVDTKKKENIGNFQNKGKVYCPQGEPTRVDVHDFIDKDKGKAAPFGIYDCTHNKGWVSVGMSSDTSAFAVNSIRTWWCEMGKATYPDATELMITADCGGSNSNRTHLWKASLQTFANETGLTVHVSHFPPGTSKWNKIEHRMFCYITKNWQGIPLVDRATVIALIGSTRTKAGLTVFAQLDENTYPTGVKVSKEVLAQINMTRKAFHGEWNYSIAPQLPVKVDEKL